MTEGEKQLFWLRFALALPALGYSSDATTPTPDLLKQLADQLDPAEVSSLQSSMGYPCCTWVTKFDVKYQGQSKGCDFTDAVTDKNSPATTYDSKNNTFTYGGGVYSQDCAAYLEQCPEGNNYMPDVFPIMVEAQMNKGIPFLLVPDTPGRDVPGIGATLTSDAWDVTADKYSNFLTENKMFGAAYQWSEGLGTYMGIYNCETAFEKEIKDKTGCDDFKLKYNSDKYIGSARHPTTSANCQDVKATGEDATCSFNLFPYDKKEDDVYVYAFNPPIDSEGPNGMDITGRGWFEHAMNQSNSTPVFFPPYQNYSTLHPVFGFTRLFAGLTDPSS